jgi:hypothetical protein
MLLAGTTVPAQAATLGWRQVYKSHYGATANNSTYTEALVFSTSNAWVLGGTNEGFGYAPSGKPVAVHWDGKTWRPEALPSQATGYVTGASATSATDAWAVTQYSAYVLHWNGKHWSVSRHLPANGGEVTGIAAISPGDVWVFGGGGAIGGIGTWHYDGKTWQRSTSGSALGLENASAISAKDIWGVGGALSPYSQLVRYNGKAWQPVTAKALSGLQFGSIAAFSDKDVWVSANKAGFPPSFLLHYNGKAWTTFTTPWKVQARPPQPDGHGGLWFIGYSSTGQRYLMDRSASGKWTRSAIPGVVPGDVVPIRGTATAWAIGAKTAGPGTDAVIWADGKV